MIMRGTRLGSRRSECHQLTERPPPAALNRRQAQLTAPGPASPEAAMAAASGCLASSAKMRHSGWGWGMRALVLVGGYAAASGHSGEALAVIACSDTVAQMSAGGPGRRQQATSGG